MSAVFLVAVMAAPVAFVAWLVISPGGDNALLWFDDSLLFVTASAAAIAALLASLRYEGTKSGRAWGLIFIGMALMALGEGAWGFQELILGQEVTSPAAADIGYLGFYPPIFLGLLLMPQAPVTGLRRYKLLLDIALPLGAAIVISGHYVIADLVSGGGLSSAGDTIGIAYPILDLTIVFAAILVVVRGGRNLTNASLGLLAVGFLCIAISDSLFTYLTQTGAYDSGSSIDTGWVIGYALIAVAGLLAAGRQLNFDTFREEHVRPLAGWQTLSLYVPIVPVAAMVFAHVEGSQVRVDLLVMIGFVSLIAVAVVRQMVTHIENARLNAQLQELTDALERKVRVQRMQQLPRVQPPARISGPR
jgi:hypothetical protein